jgi:uncharacterized membrane protein YphA (DoxX/SURF4 family)
MKLKIFFAAVLLTITPFLPSVASAHENYVLTKAQIDTDVAYHGPNVFSSLENAGNARTAAEVAIVSTIFVILYFFFDHSHFGRQFNKEFEKLEPIGHVILRFALAISLFASAHFFVYLGPEIPLTSLPLGILLNPILYILGLLLILGFWTEIAAGLSLIVLILSFVVYKDYMLTYFNYFGEFLALMLFGTQYFSLDSLLRTSKAWVRKYYDYEVGLIRITYGISILYPAITYKLLHPEVIIDIATRYNLTQIHWLFPRDPLLISLGTGLAQLVVGICLIIGFETRLNTLITFALMVLSVLYFKEAVWPHYILLALSLYLTINNGGAWSVDGWIERKLSERRAYHALMAEKKNPAHSG